MNTTVCFKNQQSRCGTNLLLVGLFCCLGGVARGQTFDDKLFVNYSLAPPVNFRDIPGKSHTYNSIEVQLSLPPVRVGSRLQWVNVLYSKSVIYNFDDTSESFRGLSERFSDIRYTSLFNYKFANPKWALLVAPTVMVRTDFADGLSTKDLFPQGAAFATYAPHGDNSLVFSVGAVLTNDFNHNLVAPLVGLVSKTERLTVELTYPRVNILYKPTKKLEWGVTATADAAIFKSKRWAWADHQTSQYVRTVNLFAGQALNYKLHGGLWLNTQVGYAFLRNYDLLDADYQPIKAAGTDLEGSFMFKAGVSLRFGQ